MQPLEAAACGRAEARERSERTQVPTVKEAKPKERMNGSIRKVGGSANFLVLNSLKCRFSG